MKAYLNLDQFADASKLTPELAAKVKHKFHSGGSDPYFPAGTEFDGDQALMLCRTGQASPADDECSVALNQTPAEQAVNARKYLAAQAGIKGKKDMELFMAGVIEGYDKTSTDANPVYLPGPNFAAWEAAKAEIQTEKGDI